MLDILTLLILLAGSCLLISATFLFVWLHDRTRAAFLWWCGGFSCGFLGIGLLAARGRVADWASIDLANSLVLIGVSMCWAGVRIFDGRRVPAWSLAAAAAIWLATCQIPFIYESTQHRTTVASLLLASLAYLLAWELWRGKDEILAARRALVLLCLFQGLVFTARSGLSAVLGMPQDLLTSESWFGLLLVEPFVLLFLGVILVIALDKQRTEKELKRLAAADPLTPALNRRGFVERCEHILARSRLERHEVSLLLFDLDHFKAINDRFGHLAGDSALIGFCEVAQSKLRPDDVFGRLGGEEFAALLNNAGHETALVVAERIRAAFNRHAIDYNGLSILATVSVGIAVMPSRTATFDGLMELADKALYDAKAKGRNRVSHHLSMAS